MPPSLSEKLKSALDEITLPLRGASYTVGEYFGLPPEQRGDDEADVVDMRLTRVLLRLLDYEDDSEWEYNRNKAGGRPDFLVVPAGRPVFFIENKRTSFELSLPQIEPQLRRYAETLTPVGLAFNGRELLAVRLAAGRITPILRVDILVAARIIQPDQLTFDPSVHETNLAVLIELFRRSRFVEIQNRLGRLTCSEADWRLQASDINQCVDSFGENAARLIVRLSLIIHANLMEHLQEAAIFSREIARLEENAINLVADAAQFVPPNRLETFVKNGERSCSRLGRVGKKRFDELLAAVGNQRRRRQFTERFLALNSEAKTLELHYEEPLEVSRRYERWLDLEQRFEASMGETDTQALRPWRFARQCAYVLFLRIFLIRILEDKGLLPARLITDGGLDLWLATIQRRFAAHLGDLSSAPLIELALGQAAAIFGDLQRKDLYDWFVLDDTSVLDILEVLHGYDFKDLAMDVIGYTYQRFLEETERHRLGHYLTPPAVIDHILDCAGYISTNEQIIGRDVLDPACGSGSFLVHAAVRYRRALSLAYGDSELTTSRAFLDAIHERFIGIDINPFSCYLARINLLVQALDDIGRLRSAGETPALAKLCIFNADSLDFRGIQEVLGPAVSDEVLQLKVSRAGQIAYVFANPPYINVKQENIYLADIQALPFFSEWLYGDANTYLLFLRVGLHFLAREGTLAYIVPSTVLGDQQAGRFRQLSIRDGFRLTHVTRFYVERVLFKPVEQATSVLIMNRTTDDGLVQIAGGGKGADSKEAIADVTNRPTFHLPNANLRQWLSPSAIPTFGAVTPPGAGSWMQVWPVVPEHPEYYQIWERLCSGARMTVGQLFSRLGYRLEGVVAQGDVNTTHVSPFHVSGDTQGSMPLYKGEEIDQLVPLDYLPTRGPRGRAPFLLPTANASVTGPRAAALAKLQRLANLGTEERGFVLHEVAKFRVRRRIAGTYFKRGPRIRNPVFPHTLWVFSNLPEDVAYALLGFLTSLPVNFGFHFCSTNNHVVLKLLECLPVPEQLLTVISEFAERTREALSCGGLLVEFFEEVGVNRSRALRSGVPKLDPVLVLQKKRLPSVQANTWLERRLLQLPSNSGLLERLTVGNLVERREIQITNRPDVSDVFRLWINAYGRTKWREFRTIAMPDNPTQFLRTWQSANFELRTLMQRREESQRTLDDAVAELYDIPSDLREIINLGPPWLAEQRGIDEFDNGENADEE